MSWRSLIGPDTWIISDTHWSHNNIRIYGERPDNHFELMRENWIGMVKEDDVILHLGDLVCYGDEERHPEWIEGLPGQKLLIRGNHDKHKFSWYENAGFKVIGRARQLISLPDYHDPGSLMVSFSHEPDADDGAWDINIHGHIHINPYWTGTERIEDRINVCVEKTDYKPVKLGDLPLLEGLWA